FLAGVSLAVAAIPEGLPAIVTVALALGVQRMIKRKAIVRKLPSVETLGCASVICSDKTGTLTQNKMTVTRMWLSDRTLKVTGDGYEPVGKVLENEQELDVRHDNSVKRLLQISALCNNARIEKQETVQRKGKAMVEQEEWVLNGDPTEGALTVLAAKLGSPVKLLETQYRRIQEFPFDSERKLMSVVSEHQGGRILHVKGAPDVLLDQCTHILWQGKVISMTPALKAKCQAANEKMAQSALRVLAFAYRDLTSSNRLADAADAERNLIFVGLTGMIDPPRAEVKDAIATCRAAGIKTVMITGDHQLTAEAIAGSLGIIPRGGETLSGKQLEQLSDEELDQRVENIYVYARVSPEHKLRIVRSLQRKGHVVAMTGDGVNDAPAIKAADIGI